MQIFQRASSSWPVKKKKNIAFKTQCLSTSDVLLVVCNIMVMFKKNKTITKTSVTGVRLMKRKQTSTSAALAEPAAVKTPNLSFLFFSFSSSSIWKQRGKKSLLTTIAQSRRAETSVKDLNQMSAVTSGIVPFVKQKKH